MRSEDRSGARGSGAALLAVLIGVGCSGGEHPLRADGAAEVGGDAVGYDDARGCALLDETECAADPRCRPILGQGIFSPGSCVLPPVIFGCVARECNGPPVLVTDVYQLSEAVVLGGCLPSTVTPIAGTPPLSPCAPCDPLSITQCKATPYCQVIVAQPVDDLRSCMLAVQDVGCALGAFRCDFVSTRATDTAGKLWAVPGACVPPGWSATSGAAELPSCDYPTGPEACASLSVRDCLTDASCRLLTGKPIDDRRSCALSTQPAGCIRADAICGNAITRARDQHQTSWIFSNTCLPADWVTVSGTSDGVLDCPSADGGADGR